MRKIIRRWPQKCYLCCQFYQTELSLCKYCFVDLPRCPPINQVSVIDVSDHGIRFFVPCLWYQHEVKFWIQGLKFKGWYRFAENMAVLMVAQVLAFYQREQAQLPDFLLPVPMTPAAQIKRGYNQAYLLAQALSELLGIPLLEGVSRIEQKQKAHRLSGAERKDQLGGDFIFTGKVHSRARIALIDDVLTTGATAKAVLQVFETLPVYLDVWTVALTPKKQSSREGSHELC